MGPHCVRINQTTQPKAGVTWSPSTSQGLMAALLKSRKKGRPQGERQNAEECEVEGEF